MSTVKSITAGEASAIVVDFFSGNVWPRALGIAAASSLAVAWQFWRKRLQQSKGQQSLPPGSFGLPWIGQTIPYLADPVGFIKSRLARFGGTFTSHIFFQPSVVLAPSSENMKLLTKEAHSGFPAVWDRLLGKSSMIMTNGELHTRIRREGTRAFTDEMLDKYLGITQQYTEANLANWASRGGKAKDIFRDCKSHTFAVAQQSLMGVKMPPSDVDRMITHFTNLLGGFTTMLLIDLPFLAFGKAMAGRRAILEEYGAALEERKAALAAGAKAECAVDTVLSGSGMSEEEIFDFVLTMLFAGHDTTTVFMQTVLRNLKALPGAGEIEAELRAEADAAWDGVAPITRQSLKQAPKLQAFIQESLRTLPPVSIIFRNLQKDLEVDGYTVPKGFNLVTGVASIGQRLEDPEKFDLNRHIDSNGRFHDRVFQIDDPGFGSFGTGPRHCIGHRFARDNLAIFMLVLLRKYDYRLESSTLISSPFNYWKCTAAFTERALAK